MLEKLNCLMEMFHCLESGFELSARLVHVCNIELTPNIFFFLCQGHNCSLKSKSLYKSRGTFCISRLERRNARNRALDMSVLPKNRQLVFPYETTSGIRVTYFLYPY